MKVPIFPHCLREEQKKSGRFESRRDRLSYQTRLMLRAGVELVYAAPIIMIDGQERRVGEPGF